MAVGLAVWQRVPYPVRSLLDPVNTGDSNSALRKNQLLLASLAAVILPQHLEVV